MNPKLWAVLDVLADCMSVLWDCIVWLVIGVVLLLVIAGAYVGYPVPLLLLVLGFAVGGGFGSR